MPTLPIPPPHVICPLHHYLPPTCLPSACPNMSNLSQPLLISSSNTKSSTSSFQVLVLVLSPSMFSCLGFQSHNPCLLTPTTTKLKPLLVILNVSFFRPSHLLHYPHPYPRNCLALPTKVVSSANRADVTTTSFASERPLSKLFPPANELPKIQLNFTPPPPLLQPLASAPLPAWSQPDGKYWTVLETSSTPHSNSSLVTTLHAISPSPLTSYIVPSCNSPNLFQHLSQTIPLQQTPETWLVFPGVSFPHVQKPGFQQLSLLQHSLWPLHSPSSILHILFHPHHHLNHICRWSSLPKTRLFLI